MLMTLFVSAREAPPGPTAPGTATPPATGNQSTPNSRASQPQSRPPAPPSGDLRTSVREVSQLVRPAVVQVTNQQTVLDRLNQPFSVPAGVGSGVIYDDQGHILTNNHVIEGARSLQVALPDGRSLAATLVGADEQTDLAVLQVSGDNLPVARLGSSAQL